MNRIVSQSRDVQISVSLSKLIPSQPQSAARQAGAGMPTAVWWRPSGRKDCWPRWWCRPTKPTPVISEVIAGNRRLAALREAYKEPPTAEGAVHPAGRRRRDRRCAGAGGKLRPRTMHPLDEAEAFAKLAQDEAKRVESIAAEFGVGPAVRSSAHEVGDARRADQGRLPPGRNRHRDRRGVRIGATRSAVGSLAGSGRKPATRAARSQRDRQCVDRRGIGDVRPVQAPGCSRQQGFVCRARPGGAQGVHGSAGRSAAGASAKR